MIHFELLKQIYMLQVMHQKFLSGKCLTLPRLSYFKNPTAKGGDGWV